MVFTNWNLSDEVLKARRELNEAADCAFKIREESIKSAEEKYSDEIRVIEDRYNQKVKSITKKLWLSYFQQDSFKILYSHILEMIKNEEDRYFINIRFDDLKELIYYDIKENPNYSKAIKEFTRDLIFQIKMKPNGEVYFEDGQGEEE